MSDSFLDFLFVQGANVLSFFGCICLLTRMYSLPYDTQQRLFPRQVILLAQSDLIFHSASCFLMVIGIGGFLELSQHERQLVCGLVYPILELGTNASALCTMHMAMAFALQALRFRRSLKAWTTCLWFIYPVALSCTSIETYVYPVENGEDNQCHVKDWQPDYVFIWMLLLSFISSLISNVAILVKVLKNESSNRGHWLRAAAYPFNFIVCQGCVLYMCLSSILEVHLPRWFIILGVTMQNLNGFVNAATYFAQSFFVAWLIRRQLRDAGSALGVQSQPPQGEVFVPFEYGSNTTGNGQGGEEFFRSEGVPARDVSEAASFAITGSMASSMLGSSGSTSLSLLFDPHRSTPEDLSGISLDRLRSAS